MNTNGVCLFLSFAVVVVSRFVLVGGFGHVDPMHTLVAKVERLTDAVALLNDGFTSLVLKVDNLDQNVDRIDQKFETLDRKVDKMSRKIDYGLDSHWKEMRCRDLQTTTDLPLMTVNPLMDPFLKKKSSHQRAGGFFIARGKEVDVDVHVVFC